MIVDPSVLGEFGSLVRRERKVGILDGDLCRSLFGYQAGYLRSDVNYLGLHPGQALQLQTSNIKRGGAGGRNGTD